MKSTSQSKYPFVIHICVPTINEYPYLTHTHGLEDVGMLEMVYYREEEFMGLVEGSYINKLYDYYSANEDAYEQLLLEGEGFYDIHTENDLHETNLTMDVMIIPENNEMIKDAYDGMDVKNKEFILLRLVTEKEKSILMMDMNINSINGAKGKGDKNA